MLMPKKKMTAEERLLKVSFGNCYDKELPREDEKMFFILVGIDLARSSCKFAQRVMDAQLFDLTSEEELKKNELKLRMFTRYYESFISYICEVKGFPKKSCARLYSEWYKMMVKRYDENKEEWCKCIKHEMFHIFVVNEMQLKNMIV